MPHCYMFRFGAGEITDSWDFSSCLKGGGRSAMPRKTPPVGERDQLDNALL